MYIVYIDHIREYFLGFNSNLTDTEITSTNTISASTNAARTTSVSSTDSAKILPDMTTLDSPSSTGSKHYSEQTTEPPDTIQVDTKPSTQTTKAESTHDGSVDDATLPLTAVVMTSSNKVFQTTHAKELTSKANKRSQHLEETEATPVKSFMNDDQPTEAEGSEIIGTVSILFVVGFLILLLLCDVQNVIQNFRILKRNLNISDGKYRFDNEMLLNVK